MCCGAAAWHTGARAAAPLSLCLAHFDDLTDVLLNPNAPCARQRGKFVGLIKTT